MKFDNLNKEQLEKRIFAVLEELSIIKAQVEQANAEYMEHGKYLNPDWAVRAKHALRMKGREHQMLCKALADIKKSEKKESSESFSQRFMDVARSYLTKDDYMEIMKRTAIEG